MVTRLVLGLVIAGTLLMGVGHTAQASGRTVILLYGWNGTASSWNTAKAAYQANGDTVYVLTLPKAGWSAGETETNATYVQSFITNNHLTNVQVDGHSLGGWLVLDLILIRKDSRITSGVLRDTGTGCYFGIPGDQCAGSTLLTALAKAPVSSVPILNLSHSTDALPQVDSLRIFNLPHDQFLTNAAVNAAAVAWQ